MRWTLFALFVSAACGSKSMTTVDGPHHGDGGGDDDSPPEKPTIFVIPMENKALSAIIGNTTDAPYINGLLATAASTSMFTDELPSLDSEPHYVWMEAGTNSFDDVSFTNDNPPTAGHSTHSTQHLVTQLEAAGVSWMSYQEDIAAGSCPIASTGEYAPKHDPFVFFQDVVGNPPSATNAHCIAHHKPYSAFAGDLAAGMDGYVFITPNLCNDMHGDPGCSQGTSDPPNIKAGDNWLKAELPRLIAYTMSHDRAALWITWDEGDATNLIPFIAIGKHVKPGVAATMYSHSSLLKSAEEVLGVPVLSTVTSANDFADMYVAGSFP